MPTTQLCRTLGIDHPILSVGFAAGAGPELASVRRARRGDPAGREVVRRIAAEADETLARLAAG